MEKIRIIPCLDIRDGRVVKGQKFKNIKDIDEPVKLAGFYNESGADELVFYDITAANENRPLFYDLLKEVKEVVDIPLTVGGNIRSLEDFERVFAAGANKVSINSGALANKNLIKEAAKKFGSKSVVLSMDIGQADGGYKVFLKGGSENSGIDMIEWAKFAEDSGAGEIVLNSIDNDGVRQGYDVLMLEALYKEVSLPIVASGGAGNKADFLYLFKNTNIKAALAAGIFHSKELLISDLKSYLLQNGIE